MTLVKEQIRSNIENAKRRPIGWAYIGEDVIALIDNFYKNHPEDFEFPNRDESAYSPKLLQYLASQETFIKSGFSIDGEHIISPFGDPVALCINTNNNSGIYIPRYVNRLPWKSGEYSCMLIWHAKIGEVPNSADWVRLN